MSPKTRPPVALFSSGTFGLSVADGLFSCERIDRMRQGDSILAVGDLYESETWWFAVAREVASRHDVLPKAVKVSLMRPFFEDDFIAEGGRDSYDLARGAALAILESVVAQGSFPDLSSLGASTALWTWSDATSKAQVFAMAQNNVFPPGSEALAVFTYRVCRTWLWKEVGEYMGQRFHEANADLAANRAAGAISWEEQREAINKMLRQPFREWWSGRGE